MNSWWISFLYDTQYQLKYYLQVRNITNFSLVDTTSPYEDKHLYSKSLSFFIANTGNRKNNFVTIDRKPLKDCSWKRDIFHSDLFWWLLSMESKVSWFPLTVNCSFFLKKKLKHSLQIYFVTIPKTLAFPILSLERKRLYNNMKLTLE